MKAPSCLKHVDGDVRQTSFAPQNISWLFTKTFSFKHTKDPKLPEADFCVRLDMNKRFIDMIKLMYNASQINRFPLHAPTDELYKPTQML